MAVSVAVGATVDGETGRPVDKCSSPGIGTGGASVPEERTDVDRSESVGS